MAKNKWIAKNKTDKEVEKKLKEQEFTNYFGKAPKALQNVVRIRFAAGIVLLIISVILLFTKITIGMVVPPAIIGIIAMFTSMQIRNVTVNGTYKTFSGTVVGLEYTTPLKTRAKAVIFVFENKRYRIMYNTRKLKIGDILTVYAPNSVLIYERNGINYINSYYAVDTERV